MKNEIKASIDLLVRTSKDIAKYNNIECINSADTIINNYIIEIEDNINRIQVVKQKLNITQYCMIVSLFILVIGA